MKKTFKISGMTCDGCRRHVENTLKHIDGVSAVQVDLQKQEAMLEADREIDSSVFKQAFEEEGGMYQIMEIE